MKTASAAKCSKNARAVRPCRSGPASSSGRAFSSSRGERIPTAQPIAIGAASMNVTAAPAETPRAAGGPPAARGVSAGAAVTFMLAAPIAMGWAVGIRSPRELLKALPDDDAGPDRHGRTARAFFEHFAADAVFMGGHLVVGAAAAATLQTFVPESVMSSVAGTYGVDVVAMMALAGVLSLCSESDAFVAASFVQFGPAPQLAFLVFGPLMNLKLASLYVGTFRRGFLAAVLLVAAGVTLAGTLWIEALVR